MFVNVPKCLYSYFVDFIWICNTNWFLVKALDEKYNNTHTHTHTHANSSLTRKNKICHKHKKTIVGLMRKFFMLINVQ